MATVDILNKTGEKVGQLELSDAVFGAPVKDHLLHEVVVAQLAAKRQGTACTKGRSDVRGSTRKLYRQKGTGRARHGSARAPIFVGGGTVFGPKPRSYDKKVSKKIRRTALRGALSLRAGEQKLLVIDDLGLGEIKTKRVVKILESVGAGRSLIVDDRANVDLIKSVRNLEEAKFLPPEGLNVYDILRHDTLVVTAGVAKRIEERLLP